MPCFTASETSSILTKALSFSIGEFANGIQVHGGYTSGSSVVGARLESGGPDWGFVGDYIYSLGNDFCSSEVCWGLHCDKRSNTFLEAVHVIIHSGCWIHVGEF